MARWLSLIVGDRDLTESHSDLQLSNVDPGGFEILTVKPSELRGIVVGAPIRARIGDELIFHGRLNEPGQHTSQGQDEFSLAGVGYGAVLKDNAIREIYVDADVTKWRPPSTTHQAAQIVAGFAPSGPTVTPDDNGGAPALKSEAVSTWGATSRPYCYGIYDALGLSVADVYYAWKLASAFSGDTNFGWEVNTGPDDSGSGASGTGNLRAAGPGSGSLTAAASTHKYVYAGMYHAAAGGTGREIYDVLWTCLAVYGRHGLTKRGVAGATQPQGFFPSDIAVDAFKRSGMAMSGFVLGDDSNTIVRQAAYLDPITNDQLLTNMAGLLGWHWGVWEPISVLDDRPSGWFTGPPANATAVVSRSECDEIDVPKLHLDQLYNQARVQYTDVAGVSKYVTVAVDNAALTASGLVTRTMELSLGVGSIGAAQAFGGYALRLANAGQRGSGSAILPDFVALSTGGRKPASLLKAGRDRLRVLDIPDAGSLFEGDTRRYDTFRIQRVETTFVNGQPRTRVEFDTGADLLEVLQAQLAAAVGNAG